MLASHHEENKQEVVIVEQSRDCSAAVIKLSFTINLLASVSVSSLRTVSLGMKPNRKRLRGRDPTAEVAVDWTVLLTVPQGGSSKPLLSPEGGAGPASRGPVLLAPPRDHDPHSPAISSVSAQEQRSFVTGGSGGGDAPPPGPGSEPLKPVQPVLVSAGFSWFCV